VLSAATAYGNFNYNQAQLSVLSAFARTGTRSPRWTTGRMRRTSRGDGRHLCLTIASANWAATTSGNWSANTNWNISAPDGPNAPAVFGSAITAPTSVTLDGQHFIGTIQFNNAIRTRSTHRHAEPAQLR